MFCCLQVRQPKEVKALAYILYSLMCVNVHLSGEHVAAVQSPSLGQRARVSGRGPSSADLRIHLALGSRITFAVTLRSCSSAPFPKALPTRTSHPLTGRSLPLRAYSGHYLSSLP